MLADAGIPVMEAPFVTVGGGIGSFVTVDYLRIYGVPTKSIRVLTSQGTPWESYEYLTRVSQIPRSERIRSDSASCPDNIWGFPGYAIREAFSARSVSGFCSPLWQVLVEPIFRDYYTPRAGQVFAGLQREHDRISYGETVELGQVRMIRRRLGGGYFTIRTPPLDGAQPTRRVAYRSRYVHVAVGYPGLKFLPDLQEYRSRHRDFRKVVNAYEAHEHISEQLRRKPGAVLVRGGGIVASRVLQRLIDDRDTFGSQTRIVHLFRTYITGRTVRTSSCGARVGTAGRIRASTTRNRCGAASSSQDAQAGGGAAGPGVQAHGRHEYAGPPAVAEPAHPRPARGLVHDDGR